MENLWEKCPKCDGQGCVSKPHHIAGDQTTWSSSLATTHKCNVCHGKMIISKITGKPPKPTGPSDE